MLARGWAQFITRGLPIAVAPTQLHEASLRAAQYALPALDHRHLTRCHPRLERHHIAIAPQVDRQRLARIHRRRESRLMAGDTARIEVGEGLQHRAAGDAEAAQAMQDGALETAGAGDR